MIRVFAAALDRVAEAENRVFHDYAVVTAFALVQSVTPSLKPTGTVAFLSMAAALGLASGAVFALVAQRAPADRVGGVTGVVGAAGGLGGFIPPLFMGSIYGSTQSYAGGLIALSAVAAAVLAFSSFGIKRREGAAA